MIVAFLKISIYVCMRLYTFNSNFLLYQILATSPCAWINIDMMETSGKEEKNMTFSSESFEFEKSQSTRFDKLRNQEIHWPGYKVCSLFQTYTGALLEPFSHHTSLQPSKT